MNEIGWDCIVYDRESQHGIYLWSNEPGIAGEWSVVYNDFNLKWEASVVHLIDVPEMGEDWNDCNRDQEDLPFNWLFS